MTKTQRRNEINQVIADRGHSACYRAWYVYVNNRATLNGTIFKQLK